MPCGSFRQNWVRDENPWGVDFLSISIRQSDRRGVNNHQRAFLGQIQLLRVQAAVHRCHNILFGPASASLVGPFRQSRRIFHANTAMAEVAPGSREQLRRRGAIEIDVVRVGKHELDQAQRNVGTGLLPDTENT